MKIEQFVMAYGVEHDRLRSLMPDGFISLRPVLRVNAEIQDGRTGYVEFNTAIEAEGRRGWLNIGFWNEVPFVKEGVSTAFRTGFLDISFISSGIEGGCPAETEDAGCYFFEKSPQIRPPESIAANKRFCDCRFAWHFKIGGAYGAGIGKTLPAIPTDVKRIYPRQAFTVENAAAIPCGQVLGTYTVEFERN